MYSHRICAYIKLISREKFSEEGYSLLRLLETVVYQKYVEFRLAADDLAWNQRNWRFVRWVFYEDRARFANDRVSPAKCAKLRGRIAGTRFIRQHLVVDHSQSVIISAWRRCYRILFQVFELTAHTRRVQIRQNLRVRRPEAAWQLTFYYV